MPLSALWIPLKRSSKHEALSARAAPARGDEAKAKIDDMHASAEERALNSLTNVAVNAAMHNQKAAAVAEGAKMADTLVRALPRPAGGCDTSHHAPAQRQADDDHNHANSD